MTALATRVRKARRQFACCLCGVHVRIGESTGRLADGTGWAHVRCIVRANRQAGQ